MNAIETLSSRWEAWSQAWMKALPAWAPGLGTILSGCFAFLSFPPFDLWPLGFVFLLPIYSDLRIRKANWKAALVQGLWMSIVATVGAMYWVSYALHHFGDLPYLVTIPMLLILGLVAEINYYVFLAARTAAAPHLGRRYLLLFPVLCALLYAGLEAVLPKIWQDTAGHIFHTRTWLRQAADIGGAHLLTFFIVLVNEGLWQLWQNRKQIQITQPASGPKAAPAFGLSVLGIAFLLGYGAIRYHQMVELEKNATDQYRIGIIQANIGDLEKLSAYQGLRAAAQEMMTTYFSLSDAALKEEPRPDAVVWPETAYPSAFRSPHGTTELMRDLQVEEWVNSRKTTLLFGGYDHDVTIRKDYNTMFFLFPRKYPELIRGQYKDMVVYHKNVLLPFGEFIPFADTFPSIKRAFPQVGYFGRGPGPVALPIFRGDRPKILANPIICYEALLPSFAIEGVRKGAQMILNVTNDSWFGPYGEPYHHLAITKFRSIETRRPQLRGTNTGISALITAAGDLEGRTGVYTKEISQVTVDLPADPPQTLMLILGDWFGKTAFWVSSLLLLGLALRERKQRNLA
jgi:apolipoprotein N-acyltransferase